MEGPAAGSNREGGNDADDEDEGGDGDEEVTRKKGVRRGPQAYTEFNVSR